MTSSGAILRLQWTDEDSSCMVSGIKDRLDLFEAVDGGGGKDKKCPRQS